ncbi:hypothetical protein MED01_004234 [Micromonospora sp. MED01]|uniref:hypothetical protein n=1 Tax=Micromonospora alfalfae TaxID=2911212 RepID=UPI001EE922A2|nr:hypothetical protein [Micromonospora alfalfae]MCG5460808.1 hypothetical protein [Micromonospora alfalfae]
MSDYLDAVRALARAATNSPWTGETYRRVLAGLATSTGNYAADARFVREARELVPDLTERLARAVKERNYYAEKSDILSAELDERDKVEAELDDLHEQVAAMKRVVDAARVWRAQFTKPTDTMFPRQGALCAAVDALPSEDGTR